MKAALDDKYWMQQALDLSNVALTEGEVPVGAIVVGSDNKLLGTGYNKIISSNDITQHAEIVAIQNASQKINNYRLTDATLYVTLEPCAMCAGAILHARLKRLVFACRDFKAGCAGSVHNLIRGYPFNHKVIIDEGILQLEAAQILKDFFKLKRDKVQN